MFLCIYMCIVYNIDRLIFLRIYRGNMGVRSWITAYNQKELPENYFRVQVTILRFYGIELMKEETLLYKFYSGIIFATIYLSTIGETLEVYSQWGDLDAIVSLMCYVCTHILGVTKATVLFYNRKKFGDMIKTLHKKPFAPEMNRGGDIEEKYLRKIVKITETHSIIYLFVLLIALISGNLTFISSRIFKEKSDWQYPYAPITIVDTSDSPLFELAGTYQMSWITLFAVLIINTDIFLSIILAHLSVQFKILNNAFRSIRMRSRKMNVLTGGSSQNEAIILSHILREYITHHLRVFELAEQMEELCNVMLLAELLAGVLTLCFLLYEVSLKPVKSFDFLLSFFSYWVVAAQVGIYCYWGNEVTLQAANVAKAVAEADWIGATRCVMEAMVVIIARSQKPLCITAGNFFNLSIDTFLKIMKGSFSYFMVLKQRQTLQE